MGTESYGTDGNDGELKRDLNGGILHHLKWHGMVFGMLGYASIDY